MQKKEMSSLVLLALIIAVLVLCSQSCTFDQDVAKWAEDRIQTLGGCRAVSAGDDPVNISMSAVKLFLYHNDEDEIVADFLQYHSHVFGAKNIVVIDQDSQNEAVCKTLALFQHCGTKIITTAESFLRKGIVLSEEMLKYKNTNSLLIPLDTDEFIFPFAKISTRQVAVNREDLWKAFRSLSIDGRKFKFGFYSGAHPNRTTCVASPKSEHKAVEFRRVLANDAYYPMYAPGPGTKSFFHSDGFMRTDDGNHIGLVKNDNATSYSVNQTNIHRYFTYLDAQMVHFGIGSYKGTKDKYTRASVTMGFNGDADCTVHRPGWQYCDLSKLYVNGTDHGVKHYTEACSAHGLRSYNYTVVSDWFQKHTLSMTQLVGI